MPAIELAKGGDDFPACEVGDFGEGHTRADGIAELEDGRSHAPADGAVGVLPDGDVPGALGV